MGQHLKRHILKCAGRSMPQFKTIRVVIQLNNRRHILVEKLPSTIGLRGIGSQLRSGKALQKAVHNIYHALLVGHFLHCLYGGNGQPRQHRRSEQAAIRRQSLRNRLGRAHAQIFISRA